MCKHVAAVLYGVGSRLDDDPAGLFKLRGVNFEELIDVNQAVLEVTSTKLGKRKRLEDTAFTDLFDLGQMDEREVTPTPVKLNVKPNPMPEKLTGSDILEKRIHLRLNKSSFSRLVGVSVTTISSWERKGKKGIFPNDSSLKKLQAIW
jgi:uncharacterized Zn finger protein